MRRFRRTTLITVGCLSALAGLGLARLLSFEPSVWWLAASPILLLLRKRNFISLYLVILLGLGIGLWRGGVYMQKLGELQSLTGQKVVITATATIDSIYGRNSQIDFTANNVRLVSPESKPLAGSFKISGFGEKMIYRGDRVQVSGKLYPMRGSNQVRIAYAQLQRLKPDSSPVNKFTRRFSAGMQNALPEPESSFGLGLLIGQRNTLPQNITNQLIMVGLVHIVAVSGYNLTILVRAATRLKLRSKYQQLLLSLALIGVFVLVTGFVASIVRAAMVSALTLWAWFYGRQIKPMVILSFTAALTGLWNPFYVWGDLGWYLSFLAFFGILMLAPTITARLFSKQPKLLAATAIETLCAEVMALPFIMLMFGQLSLIGLVANVLVVPLVPLAMLLSASAAAAGMFAAPIAGWIAWPAKLLLTYMLDVVHLMSGIPSVLLHLSLSLKLMIACYALVLITFLSMRHHSKQRQSEVSEPIS